MGFYQLHTHASSRTHIHYSSYYGFPLKPLSMNFPVNLLCPHAYITQIVKKLKPMRFRINGNESWGRNYSIFNLLRSLTIYAEHQVLKSVANSIMHPCIKFPSFFVSFALLPEMSFTNELTLCKLQIQALFFQVTLGRLFQFKLIKIKYNFKFSLSVLLVAFLLFSSPIWLVSTIRKYRYTTLSFR